MFSTRRRSMVAESTTDTAPGVSITGEAFSVALTVTVSKKRCCSSPDSAAPDCAGGAAGGVGGAVPADCAPAMPGDDSRVPARKRQT